MKKIITFLLLALFTFNLSAQKIEKGIWQIEIGSGIDANYNWITGGDWKTETKLNGSSISDNDGNWNDIYDSQTNLNYDLDFTNFSDWESRFLDGISFGYFIADGLLIGLGLDLNGLNIRDNYNSDPFENDKVKWNEFKIGAIPKIRYYLPTGRGNAMFFEGSFGMGINNRNASVEGRLIPVGSDPWDYDVIAYDPITGTGISAQADENDTWNSKRNIFSSSIGLGVGYSAFLFNSREIFSIEPQIGLNINSRNRLSETTTFDESSDDTIIISSEDKISNIGVFLKLKLSFYLGRHFWSH
jgi:hypothetical protein